MSFNISTPMSVGSDTLALVNKVFTGKFIEAGRPKRELWAGDVKGIIDKEFNSTSKELQIFLMGDLADPVDFQPGIDRINGQPVKIDEVTFGKDKYLVSSASIPKDQLIHSPVDLAAKLGQKLGPRWMRKYNSRMYRLWVSAARTGARTKEGVIIHNGGNRINRTLAAGAYSTDAAATVREAYPLNSTGADRLYVDMLALGTAIREDDNDGQLIAMIDPYLESVMLSRPDQFDRTLNGAEVPNSMVSRYVGKFAGFIIYRTNNLPRNTVTDSLSKYSGNYSHTTLALGGVPAVLGCVVQPGDEIIGLNTYDPLAVKALYDELSMTWNFWAAGYYAAGVKAPYAAGIIDITTD